MCSDGSPYNLEYIAESFKRKMEGLQLKTMVKRRHFPSILKVMEAVVAQHPNWLFIDQVHNAQWVSHSAIYDPKKDRLELIEGKL
jgi:hypothetical protein